MVETKKSGKINEGVSKESHSGKGTNGTCQNDGHSPGTEYGDRKKRKI